MLLPLATHAQSLSPLTLPSGARVIQGSATISAQGTALAVQQQSDRASLNWQHFDIGSSAQVNFQQPSAQSIAINRVLGSGASRIDGSITANGQVFLLNPQGVLFGASAQVDVGGLVAGSLSLDPHSGWGVVI